MSGVNHEYMESDYVYIRDSSRADDNCKMRTHGYNYLYYHAPNKAERMEMIYRSMGRQHDWELEKFRCGKKFPDRGNKKRLVKNIVRFAKNPIAYIYWKTFKLRLAKARMPVTALGIGLILMLIDYKKQANKNMKAANYSLRMGKNVENTSPDMLGYHQQQSARQAMPLTQLLYQELHSDAVVVAPSKNQNFRKHFEMRKKYGFDLV